MSAGGFRALAIPSNMRKTIQNIKEISGNHSDDEIYAMLKECSMDPNETAQKLLHQDTFHEVKRRRDRKKENQNNRDTVDMRWRSGASGRGGRGHYISRYTAQDAGVGRNTSTAKENGIIQASEKHGFTLLPPVALDANIKDAESCVSVMANGPIGIVSGSAKNVRSVKILSGNAAKQPALSSHSQRQLHVGGRRRFYMASGLKDLNGKMGGKSQGFGKNQAAEFSQSHGGSSSSRPSSNYGSRSQQTMGSQKVGPNKEWKPKPIITNVVQGSKTPGASDSSNVSAEVGATTQPVQYVGNLAEATNKLQKEIESLHVTGAQHVVIPNHIHVPESLRFGLSFGSFDTTFVITASCPSEPDNQTNSKPVPETCQETQAVVEEHAISQNDLMAPEEADYTENSQSPEQVPSTSLDVSISSTLVPDSSDSKKETASGPQHSSVDTSVNYNFGLMPPTLGSPLGPVEASETQSHDASTVTSFVVQPPVDPSSFNAQFYRSGLDTDDRISPFPAPGGATKYAGNLAVLSSQNSQSPSEGGNSMILSTAAQTAHATQATGVMPSSVAVTQQPMALFRQPPGVHIPHYPPNYLPYGQYFSPFYVPPAMHQFLSNNAFPQQAQGGSLYPGPAAAAAGAMAFKFPISQHKPVNNPGNSAHMGVSRSYGPYGASPAGYNTGSAATAGNSTVNEELAASQFKETNVYIAGQQSEAPAVWIPTPGREISSLPANSFYNIPHQGQHVTFAPTQGGQGTFAGMYHPAQAVTAGTVHHLLQQSQAMPGAVDMVGATPNIYQQTQHSHMNWANTY